MNILFRAEGKVAGGLGHLVRCLSVAESLRRQYADQRPEITFFADDDELTLAMVQQNGFNCLKKPVHQDEEAFLATAVVEAEGNVLVVDMLHSYSPAFIGELMKHIRIVLIFNSPQAITSPDAIIVPAAHLPDEIINDLTKQTVAGTRLYEGFDYVVMNDDIKTLQGQDMSPDNHQPLRIIITTGGSDPKGILIRVLEWMQNYAEDGMEVWAHVGNAFQHRDELAHMQSGLPGNFRIAPYDPAKLIGADLAVCTFGITTYELIYLGIPSICIGHADPNTRGSAILARRYHATVDLGHIDDLTEMKFLSILDRYVKNSDERQRLSRQSRSLVDGKGAHRIATIIYELGLERQVCIHPANQEQKG